MNKKCLTTINRDAIDVADVVPGMDITIPHHNGHGVVVSITRYYKELVRVVFADGTSGRTNYFGQVTLTHPPVGYNYHAGHGCSRDN